MESYPLRVWLRGKTYTLAIAHRVCENTYIAEGFLPINSSLISREAHSSLGSGAEGPLIPMCCIEFLQVLPGPFPNF